MVLWDDDCGDPNRPEIIERNERLAMAQNNNNITNEGNWGQEKRTGW